MAAITRVGILTTLSFVLFAGCNRDGASNADASSAGGDRVSQIDPAMEPVAHAAVDFLDAVLKGDTDRGKARLTPQAVQQLEANKKTFEPSGMDVQSIRILQVRAPAEDHAFAQCEFTYKENGVLQHEEMCCALRKVDNDWRVSGIAYGTTPDKPWILTDFETGRDIPISRQPEQGQPNMAGNPTTSRPSPPRTAQEIPVTGPATQVR
jgi:hypothetical protein